MLHPNVLDVKITLASHDKVWWVIIVPNNRPADRIYSQKGSTTKEAAMENMFRERTSAFPSEVVSMITQQLVSLMLTHNRCIDNASFVPRLGRLPLASSNTIIQHP
jgi:hypothetical protein